MKERVLATVSHLFAPPLRLAALLAAFVAASAAPSLADASLEETGGTLSTVATDTLAFKNAKLADLTAETLSGRMSGGWAGTAATQGFTFNNFDRTSEGSGMITCQAQLENDNWLKGMVLQFSQSGNDVNVRIVSAGSISGGAIGQSLAGYENANGNYSIYNLSLPRSYYRFNGNMPAVVWDGDFEQTKYDGNGNAYTLTLPTGITLSNGTSGNLVVGSDATTGASVSIPATGTNIAVLVKYSGLETKSTQAFAPIGLKGDDNNYLSIRPSAANALTVKGYWQGSDNLFGSGTAYNANNAAVATLSEGSGYLMISYNCRNSDSGVHMRVYAGATIASMTGGNCGGLRFTNASRTLSNLYLGGPGETAKASAWAGLTIEKVAIFFLDQTVPMGVSTDEKSKMFFRPRTTGADASAYYEKFGNANAILTWKTAADASGNNGDFMAYADVKYDPFNPVTGTDSGVIETGGATAGNVAAWQRFCYGQSAYNAPGQVLRLVSGYYSNIHGKFSPLSLGGLIVESGATGYVVSQSDNNRSFSLGDPTGKGESYFEVNEDFTINRTAGGALMGTVNIDVADGKTFTFASNAQIAKAWNSVTGGTALPTVKTVGGALKFHGAGQLAVPTLTATGSTLDYSDLAAARATPFVSGALAVDGDTVFKFPESAAFPYPVATSVSSTASGDVTFHVGSSAYTRELWFNGGYACPERRATFAGGETAINWSDLSWDVAYSDETRAFSRIAATASGTLALGAVTTGKVILEVPQGVELTLTGTLAASEIVVTGAGTVVCSAANTLQGTVTGDGTIVYSALPTTGTGGATFTDTGWQGVLWLKSAMVNNFDGRNLGSAYSVLRFTGCTGYAYALSGEKSYECSCTIDLQDDGETKALTLTDGYGGWRAIYKALTGTGTLYSNTATGHYYIFKDATAFAGTISLDTAAFTHVVLGNATATDTTAGSVYVASGASATVATGKTWTAPGGFAVNGTLAVVGTGAVSGDLSLASGATLDLAAYTGSQAVSGAFAPSANSTLLLPAGATLPYQVAASGDAFFAHFTYQIGSDAAVTGPVVFDGGALLADGVKTATLEGMGGIAIDTLFGNGAITWAGSGNHYVLTLTAANSLLTVGDTTGVESLTIIVQNDGALFVSGELPENTVVEGLGALTVAENATAEFYTDYTRLYSQIGADATGNGAISTSGTTISAGGALVQAPLAAGNYTLARWLSPQKLSTGYGYAANVSTTVASGCAYELVYMADRIVLRVYDTAAQTARGTLKIWPYGDSITEGFNSSDTTANYRVLLAQKLSLLGYNVEMVGCYDRVQSTSGSTTAFFEAKDPSGQTVQTVPAAWAKHSAKHGGTVGVTSVTSYQRSAMVENVDTLAAQAGSPDVVLLHGGINDLSVVSDANTVFANWTNVVWRLLTDLPNAKIVVSTTLYATYGSAGTLNPRSDAFNALVRAQVAKVEGTDDGAFPAGRVILADLNNYVKSTEDGILSGDKLHPDWWGHDQMAEGWLAAIKTIYSANGPDSTFASAGGLPAVDSSDLGAAAKTELADYRKGFTRYGWFEATGAKDVSSITYSDVDSDAAASNITKVAYFVEYVRADNNAHKWVWVDMDAFGTTIADVGLPAATHQQAVTNLHVKSNHNGIEDVAADVDGVTGWIQFSPYDYSGAESGVSGAPTSHGGSGKAMFDWNNLISASDENVDGGANACMQVFRVSPSSGRPAQTLFAYNNWRSSTLPAEFGIGNFAQHFWGGAQTLDYTYTRGNEYNNFTSMNADAYTVKRIEIWTKGASEYITNDKKGGSTAVANFSSETWQLTVPGTAGNFVKLDKILLGLRSDNAAEMAKRTVVRLTVSTAQGTVAVSDLMNGDGNAQTSATFADGAYPQTFEFGEDCVLECGTAYTLTMIDSSGAANAVWPAWLEAYAGAASYSPIANTVSFASNWRVAQSLYASKVRVATVSADVASFSALAFSPAVPADASEAALLVNVTANATVTLGDAMPSVGSIRFYVAEGVTLTLADPANIPAGEVVFYGPGRVAFGATPDFGAADVEFAGSPTVALALGQTIATTGDVVIDKNAALTLAPATITDPTATLVSATAFTNNGTLGLTAPDEGSDYSIASTATGVTLRRVTKEAFSYNAYPNGGNPAGWFTSWGGETFSTVNFRVGPSSAIPYVYYVDGANSKHPYYNLTGKSSAFSFSIYADVSQMTSNKGIIAEFGTVANGLVLYRQGDYVKVARLKNSNIDTPAWVPGIAVQAGYHLWTVTFDPATGAAALYLDGGALSSATDGSTNSHFGTGALAAGFQVGSMFAGVGSSGFTQGTGLAVCSMRGYDVALTATEIATLAESFPATDGNVTWNVAPAPSIFGNTYIVTSTTIDDSHYLGVSVATMTIPSGSTVSTKHLRVLNSGYTNDAATLNIEGELDITSVSTDPNVWSERNNMKGILFGHWTGTGTYNITGALRGPDAYLETVYTAGAQTNNINGGTVSIKGLYAHNANSIINLYNNGVLEVKEILSTGSAITKNFRWGTFRILADATETRAINFSAASGNATTLDPYGHTLTLESAALTGTGDITVADSSDGAAGKVVFPAGSGYTGRLILTDDNAANMDISAYTGKIVLRGTAAAIAKLDGYTGIVIIDQAGTYDATAIDLSGAAVQVTHANAVLNATAGKEGNVAVIAGTCNLYADNNTFLYDGHIFTGGVNDVGATLAYYHSEAGSAGSLAWNSGAAFTVDELAEVKSGNNIAPYFKIFTGHEDGDNMSGSLAVATDWNAHTAEDEAPTGGNMAIRVEDDKTLTVEVPSAVSFGEVQVFGSGSVVFTGEAALTITKGMYVTPGVAVEINPSNVAFTGDGNPGVHVDYGLTAATSGTVVLAGGTAESPYAPYIYGQGAVVVSEGAVASLANQQNAIAYLTVDGRATARASASTLSTLTVSATGVLDVPAGATVSPATLTVNGTMNMASTATLSDVTTLSGTGGVYYTGKLPDGSWWKTGTASVGWRGTVGIKDYSSPSAYAWNINNYGSQYSTLEVDNCYAYYFTKSENVIGPTLKLVGNGLKVANGNGSEQTIFKALSGSGTLTKESTPRHCTNFGSSPEFYGSIVNSGRRLVFGNSIPNNTDAAAYSITVDSGYEVSLGDGATWSSKRMFINGTLLVKGTGNLTVDSDGSVAFGNDATLAFDDIGTSEAPKKLTLNSAVTVASANTVNIALGAEAAAALYDGAVLIDWTAAGAAPEGSFALSDSSLAAQWTLDKTSTGLVVSSAAIKNSDDIAVGYMMQDGTAVITNQTGTITIPSKATALATVITGVSASFSYAGTAITDVNKNMMVHAYATDANGAMRLSVLISPWCTISVADGTITLALNVEEVTPNVDTTVAAPMAGSGETVVFSVPMKAGLWYAVESGTEVGEGGALGGTTSFGAAATSDTNVTGTLAAPLPASGAAFYKIAVGASKAAVTDATP